MELSITILIVLVILVLFIPWEKIYHSRNLYKSLRTHQQLKNEKWERVLDLALKVYTNCGRKLSAEKISQLSSLLIAANIDKRVDYKIVEGMRIILVMIFSLLSILLLMSDSTLSSIVQSLVMVIAAYFVPENVLSNKAKARKNAIRDDLPSVLNTLAIITDSGLGFNDAIKKVCEIRSGELIEELKIMHLETQMGFMQSEALYRLASRCQIGEVHTFIFALVQAQEKGASGIADTLRSQSEEIWNTKKARAEEMGEKASSKIFLSLLIFVFPAFFIFILGPALIDIMRMFN